MNAIDYRLPESKIYFKQLGYEWVWGRGLGGTFNLGGLFGRGETEKHWPGVHIGWITFTLKGGIFFLLSTLALFLAVFQRDNFQKNDAYQLVAFCWIPVFFVNWLVNPVVLNTSGVIIYGLTFVLLARFGKKRKFAAVL